MPYPDERLVCPRSSSLLLLLRFVIWMCTSFWISAACRAVGAGFFFSKNRIAPTNLATFGCEFGDASGILTGWPSQTTSMRMQDGETWARSNPYPPSICSKGGLFRTTRPCCRFNVLIISSVAERCVSVCDLDLRSSSGLLVSKVFFPHGRCRGDQP